MDVTASVSKVPPASWVVIDNEKYRTYHFAIGDYTIIEPVKLNVKRKPEGDSHRVLDAKNIAHYVPAGWLAITWEGKNGEAFSF
jgi:hypothetical protein